MIWLAYIGSEQNKLNDSNPNQTNLKIIEKKTILNFDP